MTTKPLIIIGTGLAGYMFAKEFRKLDAHTPLELVTADGGEFYSKPLLSTGLAQGKNAEQLAMFSAIQMSDQLSAKIHIHSQVERIDCAANSLTAGEQVLHYENLILACGSTTKQLPLAEQHSQDIISINSLQDYAHFGRWLAGKQHIAILGSGLVGCEFANDLLVAGYQVSIIAPDSYPLAQFIPQPAGEVVQQVFANKGLNWYLNNTVAELQRTSAGYRLLLSDQSVIEVDGVLSAVGLQAARTLAEDAGIATNIGVQVDRYLRTNIDNIYALGDCAEVAGHVKQYVAPLLQCARALAKTLASGEPALVQYPAMPIVIKTTLCPVVCLPPPIGVQGTWQYSDEGNNLRGLFYDEQQQLRGFVLLGQSGRDKIALAKQIPATFV